MADNKKYYYLKLKDNFYDSESMIILQNMPDGYLYSDILMKLYLRSLKNGGKLMFNNMIPYTPSVLAQVVRHQVGTVEKALNIFQQLGLIEVLDNGAIYMLDIQNFIGESSTEADRKRKYREKIKSEEVRNKLLLEDKGQMSSKCPDKTTPEIEIDIDIEKEIDVEIEKNKKETISTKIESFPKSIINFYNNNVGMITPYQLELLNTYVEDGVSEELIILAMKKAVESDKRNISYIKSILNSWKNKGITTVIEAEKESENFRKNKNNKYVEESEEEKKKRKIKELEELTKK